MTKRVKRGFWQEWDNVENEIQNLCDELGHFPAHSDFKENNLGGLLGAISKYYGGIKKVRKKMGAEVHLSKKRNKWSKLKNVLLKVKEIEKQLGHFPTIKEVKELGYSSLVSSVYRYHDCWDNIRKKLGQKPRNNRWDKKEDVLKYLKFLFEELGYFPTRQDLVDRKESSIIVAIRKKHGGMRKIKNELGIEISKPDGHWKDFNNVKLALEDLEKELGHFPSSHDLQQLGYSGLRTGIYKYHQSYNNIRKKLKKN